MDEEFFNIDFQGAEKLGILDLPSEEDTGNKKEVIDTNNDEPKEPKEEPEVVTDDDSAHQGKEDPTSNEKQEEGSPNISSSIALSLADNGVLQTLDEERLGKITTTEELIEAFREDQRNQLNEQQKRVIDALDADVESNRIQQYEQVLSSLNSVTNETLESEGKQFETYRKNLIYQDYINKGFDEDDAKEMVERSVESGKDIDDAKKALANCKKFYQKAYDTEIAEGKKAQERFEADQKKRIEELKKSIIEDDDFYNSLEVSKTVRNKIYDTVAKPIKQQDGSYITELQKYMKEKPNEALKAIGTLYVLTEGFTKFDGILKGTVRKKVRESTRNLERLLTQTPAIDGSLTYKSGVNENVNVEKIVGFDI